MWFGWQRMSGETATELLFQVKIPSLIITTRLLPEAELSAKIFRRKSLKPTFIKAASMLKNNILLMHFVEASEALS